MKIGLVLEGGAMKGMHTSGVLDVFLDNNISFDGAIGVSAGALFGVNFVSKQHGRAIRYNSKYCSDKHYMGLYSLLTTGNVVNTEFAYYTVPQKLDIFDDETYKNGIPFYVVVTNIETGEAEYPRLNSVFSEMETLRASGAMPFFSKPVKLGDSYYLDGGVADSIPFEKFREMGYEKLVVVLTKDKDYVKGPMPKKMVEALYAKKYPEFANALINRHEMYNEQVRKLRELEASGDAFVIRPSKPLTISRIEKDPDKLWEAYNQGLDDGKEALPGLLEFLK